MITVQFTYLSPNCNKICICVHPENSIYCNESMVIQRGRFTPFHWLSDQLIQVFVELVLFLYLSRWDICVSKDEVMNPNPDAAYICLAVLFPYKKLWSATLSWKVWRLKLYQCLQNSSALKSTPYKSELWFYCYFNNLITGVSREGINFLSAWQIIMLTFGSDTYIKQELCRYEQ